MSQNVDIGLSFNFMAKNKDFCYFLMNIFSRFHKIKTKALITNLRQCSFHMNVLYKYVKFCAKETNVKVRQHPSGAVSRSSRFLTIYNMVLVIYILTYYH